MFHKINELDWVKASVFMGAVIVGWLALQGIVPEPLHDKIGGVMTAVAAGIGFWLKGNKAQPPEK